MSARSDSSEGEGDEIRPYGEDRDSSDESDEEDPEEARRIADGFIVDEDEDEDDEEDEETRRKRRKERRKKRRRERKRQRREEEEGLSEDDLELLNENAGYGPSRPLKRLRRRSGSEGDDDNAAHLQDMFDDDNDRRALDDDDDDLADFIEEDDDDDAGRNETEEQRRQRKREEKQRRREAARARPELAGVDKESWNEIFDVFGDGTEYDWALEGEEGMDADEDESKKDLRLEDVFDPAEIKARRLQDEDRAIGQVDRPERHQLANSTLSDNPILAPELLYPAPDLAAGWAYTRIGARTQFLFCGMISDDDAPALQNIFQEHMVRRNDLHDDFVKVVSTALNMMFVQHLEVPYLWHYKRDAFSLLENQGQSSVQFLNRDELWSLYNLGIRFRAIWERCEQVKQQWGKIRARRPDVKDEYLTKTLLASVCSLSIDAAAEGAEWLAFHYAKDLREIKEEEAVEEGVKRLPERQSQGALREGPIMKLVGMFGLSVPRVAITFNDPKGEPIPPTNPDRLPLEVAAEFAGPGMDFRAPEDAIAAAQRTIVQDFAHDPSIRQQARDFVEQCGVVTVTPTDRGMSVIDEFHAYYTFKFLTNKPVDGFKMTPQFLHILKAEEEGLITIAITVPDEQIGDFTGTLMRCCRSSDYGEVATAWNALREEICQAAVTKHYVPAATRWVKEHLRSEAEEFVADRCRQELEFRANVRPFARPGMETGQTPSVLAITVGRGTINDAVMAVHLDDDGNVRASYKFDNLRDLEPKTSFMDLIEKRRPDVVVIGGLSAQTGKLRDDATAALRELAMQKSNMRAPVSDAYGSHEEFQDAMADFDRQLQPYMTQLIFVNDATARLYMNSEEAAREHPELPINGRYALGLARYTQNPLNAYARLGRQIASITFMEHHQKLVPEERLLIHLERGLVNLVCVAGIEINSCVQDPYERTMLPFVAGLGPRKADVLVSAISKQGQLINRLQLSEPTEAGSIFGPTIFENIAGFLTIDSDLKEFQLDTNDPNEQREPLDMTRIHPEDYEFAQKMCQDALDLDAEDVADQHKSSVVLTLMQDEDRVRKLSELNLDDFAFNLQSQGEGNKRYTLGAIVAELVQWRADRRPAFYIPNDWEVLTMLTGETERTVGRGLRVTATVRKAFAGRAFCELESGLDAVLEREYVVDDDMEPINGCDEVFQRGQAVKAVIINVEPARFSVRISTRPSDLEQSVPFVQPFREEPYNNQDRRMMAEEAARAKRRREAGSVRRVVNHPNWHVMNSGQAEQYLASMQRGDVVIRPSSKGPDHLAVTWKVDEDVYQHIDVVEIEKPNEYALGRILRIADKYSYSDLDELIIYHVKAIARKFDEIQMHEKYKPEHELESSLKNHVAAHQKSAYGFSIDSDRPGYIKLCFLNKPTKDGGVIQTWPVKVLPGAYQLNTAEVPGVTELCNAFKTQYSTRLAEQGVGGRTPGIRAGGRTPGGRTPGIGGRTPAMGGRTPAMGGRTPLPYGAGGRTPMHQPPPGYGMPPPQQGYGGAGGYGGPPPPRPPPGGGGSGPGINPERAAMMRQQGGY